MYTWNTDENVDSANDTHTRLISMSRALSAATSYNDEYVLDQDEFVRSQSHDLHPVGGSQQEHERSQTSSQRDRLQH